ncbi:MAG: M28 family peptidase [Bizionia sp.]|nr:M28 family peptidase [Bizionia sp.]
MKAFILLSAFTLIGSCATTKYSTKIENIKNSIQVKDSTVIAKYSNTISITDLEINLHAFASREFAGRKVGDSGQHKASAFLKEYYKTYQISPAVGDSTYYQTVPESFLPPGIKSSANVVAYIKGVEKPEEFIIISGHLDHLGVKNDSIHFGADDNASGTVAILEIAKAFKVAQTEGYAPKRSLVFLHLTAEEIGLYGSKFYVNNPVFSLDNTIANLNIDMIGRVDNTHKNTPNYIYLIGADRISKHLHFTSEKMNTLFSNLELDYTFNEKDDHNQYYYRSDHYNFAKHNIPVIFYFNGEHADYHKATDTPDKINYPLLQKRTQLIFATAWQLANQESTLIHNKDI